MTGRISTDGMSQQGETMSESSTGASGTSTGPSNVTSKPVEPTGNTTRTAPRDPILEQNPDIEAAQRKQQEQREREDKAASGK
jgi:hypothetical protein